MPHTHPHTHEHTHPHEHPHEHDHVHPHEHPHDHDHGCAGSCEGCASQCAHTPMEELTALMKYMASHNAAHARELAELANQLEKIGNHMAYEQVMAAVSDFEKGNLRLTAVLSSLEEK
ncbi:MAG TPA: cobalt transporter [Candidatus Faecousia excrementigallinarum]|uniref:Cobalt transporter n=1 Tax=Candidatus Faecousia excrementigallinarum TaxID=2840806 RepID=A0A9D1CLV8_9FIRM|nr:cobalt transporter [Candidatus Faecousia excrementigallinarum]